MTREEAKYAIEVMQAYVDGKDIEFLKYGDSSWVTVSAEKGETVAFDWYLCDYRIKKEQEDHKIENELKVAIAAKKQRLINKAWLRLLRALESIWRNN